MDGKGKPPVSPRPMRADSVAETMRSNRTERGDYPERRGIGKRARMVVYPLRAEMEGVHPLVQPHQRPFEMDGKGKPPVSPRPMKADSVAETMRSNRRWPY
ncbi:uncharacterized protein LOC121764886 [Salvia splendens]|uniref:uncharacterized protein LOC121764886 n=1 Tax=Salvia splendens TaxID=180675 RepID=UPI001C25D86E|nr:uncharacterized protein LOC121764886 [Salvia splendens]